MTRRSPGRLAASSALVLCLATPLGAQAPKPQATPAAAAGTRAGGEQTATSGVPAEREGLGLHWVRIPAGTVEIGCVPADKECFDREQPRHRVTLTKAFDMLATEVTLAQWRLYAAATGTPMPPAAEFSQTETHPVVNVTWDEARAFCAWTGGRLPTEVEWEHAARGGQADLVYPWGNRASHESANYGKDTCCGGVASGRDVWEYTAPVGSFPANGFGLFDMAGNAWEWMADWFDEGYYARSPGSDPTGPETGQARVTRGGSWYTYPLYMRSSYRVRNRPSSRYDDFGVRCARDVRP